MSNESGNDVQPSERTLADQEFRLAWWLEQFKLYERRRHEVETDSTALAAAALTIAAVMVATRDELFKIGSGTRYAFVVAIAALIVTLVFTSVARSVSWPLINRLARLGAGQRILRSIWRVGGVDDDIATGLDKKVGQTLVAFRDADPDIDSAALHELGLRHWQARSVSAWRLGEFKRGCLKLGFYWLAIPVLYVFFVALALL